VHFEFSCSQCASADGSAIGTILRINGTMAGGEGEAEHDDE
jgi:hypothetical protein